MTSFFTLILFALLSNRIFAKPTGPKDKNQLTNMRGASEIIEEANTNSNMTDIVNGDIILNTQMMNADPCTAKGCLWPKGPDGSVIIKYDLKLPKNVSGRMTRNAIRDAMESFEDVTCIEFSRARGKKGDRLSFQQLSGCYSYLGRQGGSQVISIGEGCADIKVVQHEILHALGLHHEQNRSDRDDYVRINYENIIPGYENNFIKISTNNLQTPYDYSSIMQYFGTAFSIDRVLPTIEPLVPGVTLGNAEEMNDNDILRVNRLYGCTDYLPAK